MEVHPQAVVLEVPEAVAAALDPLPAEVETFGGSVAGTGSALDTRLGRIPGERQIGSSRVTNTVGINLWSRARCPTLTGRAVLGAEPKGVSTTTWIATTAGPVHASRTYGWMMFIKAVLPVEEGEEVLAQPRHRLFAHLAHGCAELPGEYM